MHTLRTLAANGTFSASDWLQTSAGLEPAALHPGARRVRQSERGEPLPERDATLRGPGNRIGGIYSFNYDLQRDTFLQQRISPTTTRSAAASASSTRRSTSAARVAGVTVPQDRRFNLSFTLAGIGTFSNLLGAFGGGTTADTRGMRERGERCD